MAQQKMLLDAFYSDVNSNFELSFDNSKWSVKTQISLANGCNISEFYLSKTNISFKEIGDILTSLDFLTNDFIYLSELSIQNASIVNDRSIADLYILCKGISGGTVLRY